MTEIEQLTTFARKHDVTRLSVDRGLGPDTIFAPQPPTITLSGTPVAFPHGSFLQATQEGEEALVEAARCLRQSLTECSELGKQRHGSIIDAVWPADDGRGS